MVLEKRLYKSRVNGEYKGPVVDLVKQLEEAAQARGLTLSRWCTLGAGGYVQRITWAVHRGARPTRFNMLKPNDVVSYCILSSTEGKTRRCEAYKQLSRMLEEIQ